MQIRIGCHSLLLLMPFFISACTSSPRGVIILCAGDSITAEAYPHFLQQILNREGIRGKVLNCGRSGFSSGEYRRFLDDNRERLSKELPDFVLLQLGTNDVRVDGDRATADMFTANMKTIIGIFRTFRDRTGNVPKILLATIPPVPSRTPFPFSPESARRVIEEINPAIRRMAKEENLPVADHYALFLSQPGLLPGVHPTREGYRRLARNWHEALTPFLNR